MGTRKGRDTADHDEGDRTRVAGVEFGPLKAALREHQYPVTATELIEVYGGFELSAAETTEPLEETLARADAASFRDPADVRDAIVASITDEADPSLDDAGDWSPKSV